MKTPQDLAIQALDELYKRHLAKIINIIKQYETSYLISGDVEEQLFFFNKDIKNKIIKEIFNKRNSQNFMRGKDER